MPDAKKSDEIRRLERRLSEFQSLVHVVGLINRSLEIEDVLQASRQGIQRVLGGGFGCFVLLQPATGGIELALGDELVPPLAREFQRLVADFHIPSPGSQPDSDILGVLGARIHQILKEESQILIPLTARGKPIGILVMGLGTGRLLMPLSVDLLMSMGEQIGMAIENARLHASLRKSENWHRNFIENSPEGCWEGDLQGRIIFVNDAACQIMGYSREELLSMSPSDFTIDQAAAAMQRERLFQTGILINEHSFARTKQGEIKSISIAARLLYDDQGKPVKYQSIFRDVTEQQRLLDMLQRRNQELSTLNHIGTILSHPLEIIPALDQVCEQITLITGMETAAIFLPDPSGETLILTASRGVDDWLLQEASRIGLDDPVTRDIAVEGRIFALDDLTMLPDDGFAGPRAAGYHAGIGVPIKMHGKPAGAIFVGSKMLFKYEKSDLDLLLNISERVGMSIENRDLYEEMKQRVEELSALAELSAAITSSLDPARISDLSVEWTRNLLGVEMSSLRLVEGDALRLLSARTTGHMPLVSHIPLSPVFDSVVREHRTLNVPDLDKEIGMPSEYLDRFQSLGLRSLLFVPMLVRDQAIGVLMVGHANPHQWLENEIRLLRTIANQTATLLDNAQLYQSVLAEERKVQAIFDSGLSGLYVTDAEGRIVMFNRAAERITGWKLRDVQGKKWSEIFVDHTSPVPVEPLIDEALLRKRTHFVQESRKIQTRDGRSIPVAKAVAPLLDDYDQVTGAVGAFWDLSREQAAEISRNSFLSMVAHELRNPLTALISAVQLVENPELPRRRRLEMNEIIKSQAERLRTFSQQFLDLQKEVRSQQPVNWEILSPGNIVGKLLDQFKREHCNRQFKLYVEDPEPLVHADEDRIDHILTNLLDNAISYSPEESLITVRVHTSEDRPGTVDVSVQDRGQGISIFDQSHVFEAFYRARQAEGQRVYGHGLGLYISMEMAREMEANLELESEEGKGSTFHLILRRST